MTRRTEQRISDILRSIDRCQRFSESLDSANNHVAEMALDAIERNLQIIGEAANHLPPSVTEAHPEIAWPQIRGFRNILVHQYFGVDLSVIRDVIDTHLEQLATALRDAQEGEQ
ncbi:DUF86 domain-containing protein [Gulosibacter macacae]|uniref:DUF86 domain-containing protein n=1 Tax=Gulosibacter macacae TaxID=2488791 RepID=A0A3P3VU41_9MICO|nr:HepT-like ribonuclease domain-containing protein [Gulosibacter macacae]RRJ86200.1 DUF86 domain-containing protein [Gulosibacter macacae]